MVAMLPSAWRKTASAPACSLPPLRTPFPLGIMIDIMSDDFDGDNEYGEGGIPPDLEDDLEERIREEMDERTGDLYEDTAPRSGGCLLILALPILSIWLLR
ncbi:MAG: hypothetical protein D4R66_01815 [Opitutales bacterium]|nr:MAG: hypothetical protein D4R66_01815 [Opitutales bacterium]